LRTVGAKGTGINKARAPLQSAHIARYEHARLAEMGTMAVVEQRVSADV
jgi:hypothetical protein